MTNLTLMFLMFLNFFFYKNKLYGVSYYNENEQKTALLLTAEILDMFEIFLLLKWQVWEECI